MNGAEECDDGNTDNNDSCTNTCTLPVCGDGFLDVLGGEECDDGNTNNNDDCMNTCVLATCGDGVLHNEQSGIEQCDDSANGDADDGCSDSCETTTTGVCGAVDGTSIYDADADGSELTATDPDLCDGGVLSGFVYTNNTRDWLCL